MGGQHDVRYSTMVRHYNNVNEAIMNDLTLWAARWGVSRDALTELTQLTQGPVVVPNADDMSESAVSQRIVLKASSRGIRLFRNNVGACQDDTGRHIRYGLANVSKQMNATVKSADLIGITPVLVRADHVGHTLGVFTSIESKRGGWKYTGKGRELAQNNWLNVVQLLGGIAHFANNDGVIDEICTIKK